MLRDTRTRTPRWIELLEWSGATWPVTSSSIASLPVLALAIEDEVTGQVAPDHSNNSIQRGVRVRVSLNILRENARTGVPKLAGLQKRFHLAGPRFGRQKAAITMT